MVDFLKRHITIIGAVLWLLAIAAVIAVLWAARVAHAADTCPPGQTPIGGGECRIEVTGCPYGDSIPKDSPKCVAPEVNNNPVPTQLPEVGGSGK